MDDAFDNWLHEREPEAEVDDGRLSPGTVIGAYRIEAFLGKGGFAEVYRARGQDGEHVAIKILHRLDEQSRLRFERESNILSQIHHPNIPKLLAFGSCGDRPYLVTELLQTKDLPHTDAAVARFIKAVCAAADALHKMGYVHRDIKPSNVLWRGDTPVLIDFGLACLKSETPRSPSTISIADGQRIVVGTAGYAAPEQFAGGKIDETTDVHAIGMLADACFNGRPPKCWRKIIDKSTNSRGSTRFSSASVLARKIACRHMFRNLILIALIFAGGYELVFVHWGLSSALYGLGQCCEHGYVVAENPALAIKFYMQASQKNTDFWNGGAEHIKVGDCFANGFGVLKNYEIARGYYEKIRTGRLANVARQRISILEERIQEEKGAALRAKAGALFDKYFSIPKTSKEKEKMQ